MDEVLTCDVCSEAYREGIYEPLMLNCGHTFCRCCIAILRRIEHHSCPTCREKIEESAFDNLPVNFAILSIANKKVDYRPNSCPAHKKLLDLWCSQCQVVICGLCLASDHRDESHTIILAEDQVAELVKNISGSHKEIKQLISKVQETLFLETKEILGSLLDVYHVYCRTEFLKLVANLVRNTHSMSSIEEANTYLARLQDIETKVKKMLEDRTSQKVENTEDEIIANESEKLVGKKETSHEELKQVTWLPHGIPWILTIAVRDDANRCAVLYWSKGKLLLPSFENKSVDGIFNIHWDMFSTMLPLHEPEAYMELYHKSTRLGVVFIRLWGHLRRAQHFLALCLGTLGPSYSGGSFRSKHKELEKDRICGCNYKDTDGVMTTKGLMTDLEWSGEYAGKAEVGLVVGTSSGKSEMDSLFSIYTRVDQTANCYCPFGKVSSGIEVVRKALDYDDPKEVTVRHCGIVVPLSVLKKL
ncbi:E3 ubiquitin-protein ligase TRIM32-like [Palaemon carinicauda]|uniref:E3 ubiquitin-protein ligase TRIM32-like n=1 Tax=Palaemon carinicauda TaxID=392227 RepID=UPI0035B5A4FB